MGSLNHVLVFLGVSLSITTVWGACNGGDACCKGQCGLGEGDCDSDDDCGINLVCGSNNCIHLFTGDRSSFDSTDDCCASPGSLSGNRFRKVVDVGGGLGGVGAGAWDIAHDVSSTVGDEVVAPVVDFFADLF